MLSLPLNLAKGALRLSWTIAERAYHLVRPEQEDAAPPPSQQQTRPVATPPPPPTPARAPAVAVPEPEPPAPTPPEPVHIETEVETVYEAGPAEPHAEIQVDEPWKGYDGMKAADVIDRLVVADAATKAVVRLYEERNRKRRTVMAATGA